MDHIKILKRAWSVTWNYRVLWLFGLLLAFTTAGGNGGGGGGGGAGGGGGGNGTTGGNGDLPTFPEFQFDPLAPEMRTALITAVVAFVIFILVLIVVMTIVRYFSETALIRMVDEYEETDEKVSFRQGFRWGWSRTAWRFFLIDLLVNLPTAAAFILLFALTSLPALLWMTKNVVAGVIGTIAVVGLWMLLILLAILVGVGLSLLKHFFRRFCALEGTGVVESIQLGFAFVRANLRDVGLMWLIMIGIGLIWVVLIVPIFLLMLPVLVVFVLLGGVIGGIPALIIGLIAGLFLEGPIPWVIAGLIGLPLFILVLSAPFLLLGGIVEVFKSSTWTLTYRELRAIAAGEITPLGAGLPETPSDGDEPANDEGLEEAG